MAACPNLDLARQFAGKPVLVTGGAGFIGGHLCRTLAEGGAGVRVLDDFSSGRRGSLPATVEVIEGGLEIMNDEGTNLTLMANAAAIVYLDMPEKK